MRAFIADFYRREARLVVELDGGIHSEPEPADRDENREVYLRENRLQVLRFNNEQILQDPETVLREIAIASGRWANTVP